MKFYISYANDKFLGCTVVEAVSPEDALEEATKRGLNPGGEAAILGVPVSEYNNPEMLSLENRLVGKEEMMAQGAHRYGDLSDENKEKFNEAVISVCEECNK